MWTLQDAKNRFSAVVDAALAGQPQQVTRRGKPAVVVLSAAEYARMQAAAAGNRGSFITHLGNFPGEPDSGKRPRVAPRDVSF
ncbi:MAG TPA: type II toxin-antitoxin system Phd/YefM family antitoxin [Paracoccus sp. (in: a-proteobacteria)]|uniref:type II toxin-antitoxin system Phd/YefM family antitoxin n=1 Tax=Paracoccus sp. TaxID=267 RepID=UPI002BCF9F7C|nr:type II toxin-antitoxin system Phd/YefM family antitoxin [Paracoccus sp. (in: a-proteobacteria)]HWL57043.1 type II toxin-antitoxin system Phd/YefM family antitoxin [Paracoccus sp. (in: a-proteobacteria)]